VGYGVVAQLLRRDDEVAADDKGGGDAKRKPLCRVVAAALAFLTWANMATVSTVLRSRKKEDTGRRRAWLGFRRGMWGGRQCTTRAARLATCKKGVLARPVS